MFVEILRVDMELVLVKDYVNQRNEKAPFYVGKYLVTEKQFLLLMNDFNERLPKGDEYPRICISWFHAAYFCNRLSINHKLDPYYKFEKKPTDWVDYTVNPLANGYRLPTIHEWMHIQQNDTIYAGGSNNLDEVAWYKENSGEKLQPVGQKKPNKLGIYDLSGNAWEWTERFNLDATKVRVMGG